LADSSSSTVRWHGLDLIRLVCFFCIVEFHFGLFYFGEPTTGFADKSFIIWAVDWLGHLLMQSGFVIAFLSTLLLSLRKKAGSERLKLFGVLALGWLVLSLQTNSPIGITWDVFGLIFAGTASVMAVEAMSGLSGIRFVGLLGYLMLWIPFWDLSSFLNPGHEALKNILGVASCQGQEVSEWPLLPWVGLIWFGYWMGAEIRRLTSAGQMESLRLSRKEAVAWGAILTASVPYLGGYLFVRMGQYFSCDAYRQAPAVFWSHFVWPLCLIRCSFDPRIEARLARTWWVKRVSNLAISRKFWLAYLLQYAYGTALAFALSRWEISDKDSFQVWELPILEFIALSIIFQNELMTSKVDKLIRNLSQWRTRRLERQVAASTTLPPGGGVT